MSAGARLPQQRIEEILAAVGLEKAAHRRVRGYSLGMKQRLGLATALLGDPHNLVLDEPVNGLDPEGVHWMREVLTSAAAQGKAVLVSSHLLSEVEMVADRLVVVGRGRLIRESGMDEFWSSGSKRSVIHTTDDHRLASALAAQGANVEPRDGALVVTHDAAVPDAQALSLLCHDLDVLVLELREDRSSLEDLFLQMTEDRSDYRSEK